GLTMAIANPSQEMLVCGALATDLLKVRRDADLRYINYASQLQPAAGSAPVRNSGRGNGDAAAVNSRQGDANGSQDSTGGERAMACKGAGSGQENTQVISAPQTHLDRITDAVMKGNRNGIAAMTEQALSEGEDPGRLLNEGLLPAIGRVGDLFEQKKYFLPQLIASAEAMKNAIEVLEPHLLKDQDSESMPVIVIATVEGDIHDIGKNLVALMLKNYGFQVIDLGKDVPKETIIQAARDYHADIIALSALMTTTMQRMREVVALARQEGITAKIMIGGAVITQEYADEIHADGYSRDAAEAVKLARRLLGMMQTEN
ncbi:MAG: corrinoid protein, partial [Acetatifactor sp.]|nr:corrinoid protein [Acetatifactor sp.]